MDERKYGYPYPGGSFDPRSANGYSQQQPYSRPPYPAPYSQTMQPAGQQSQMQQSIEAAFEGVQIAAGEGFKPLSKQERKEVARIVA